MDTNKATRESLADRRIYVQLAPDDAGRYALVAVQSQLPIPRSGRMLPPEELHLTLIHFGKAEDVYANLHAAVGIGRGEYDVALERLIRGLEPLVTDRTFTLTPRGFDGLGKNGHTLVIRYDAPAELADLHARALVELKTFFAACGIEDVDAYMAADPNFTFARKLTPHVTLYKGYDGPAPIVSLSPVTMGMMKIVY